MKLINISNDPRGRMYRIPVGTGVLDCPLNPLTRRGAFSAIINFVN